jgi:hypothetical protein
VKADALERRMEEREENRVLREERAAARQAAADERRERTRTAVAAEQERAARPGHYAGARRYSVGAPSTIRAPAATRVQAAPSVVYSARPQSYMVRQNVGPAYTTQYVQPQGATRIRISSGEVSPIGNRTSNVEIRTGNTRYVV